MLIFTALKKIIRINNFSEVFLRFFLPSLCIIFTTAILLAKLFEVISEHTTSLSIIFLIPSYLALIALKLYGENDEWSNSKYLKNSAIILAGLLYFTYYEPRFGYPTLISGLIAAILIMPFLKKNIADEIVCSFACNLFGTLCSVLIASLILFIGASAIFATINILFLVNNLSSNIYTFSAILCFCCFAPFYILANIPKNSDLYQNQDYPKAVKFLTANITLPLVTIYLVILYIYLAKILIFRELPQGILGLMILLFGTIGIEVHFSLNNLQKDGGIFIKNFYKYFYYFLPIPIILLVWSALIRVNQYGITEERYLMLLIAFWFSISSFYMIFSKTKTLKFILISFCTLAILSSFGPWSASSVSEFSQIKRLKNLLKQEEILKDGKIIKPTKKLSVEYNRNVSGIVIYLVRTGKFKAISKLISTLSASPIDAPKVMSELGVDYVEYNTIKKDSSSKKIQETTLSLRNPPSLYITFFDVKNFDYLGNFYLRSPKYSLEETKDQNGNIIFKVFLEKNQIIISQNNITKMQFDLLPFAKKLQSSKQELEDFTINYKDENFQAKIYVTRLVANNLDTPSQEISSIDFIMLTKNIEK